VGGFAQEPHSQRAARHSIYDLRCLRPRRSYSFVTDVSSALWEYQKLYGKLPDSDNAIPELELLANTKLKESNVLSSVMTAVPQERIR